MMMVSPLAHTLTACRTCWNGCACVPGLPSFPLVATYHVAACAVVAAAKKIVRQGSAYRLLLFMIAHSWLRGAGYFNETSTRTRPLPWDSDDMALPTTVPLARAKSETFIA